MSEGSTGNVRKDKIQQLGLLMMGVGSGLFLSKFKIFSSTPGTAWDGTPASLFCLVGVGIWSYANWMKK